MAEAGIGRLRAKGMALTGVPDRAGRRLAAPLGFGLASPRDPARRGAHVTLHHPQAWQVSQALSARGVIADYRTPDRLRLGSAPLTTRFTDVYDAMDSLRLTSRPGLGRGRPFLRPGASPAAAGEGRPARALGKRSSGSSGRGPERSGYSHSMVPGGLLVMSSTTRFTSGTSLVIRVEIRPSSSPGSRAQSAVMASSLVTGRSTTG